MRHVTVYTDGACSGNPGPGGWGAILKYGESEKELSGGCAATTNNRMELTGVITALDSLKESCIVTVYTDSQYVVNAIEKGWLASWRKSGWKRKSGPVKNVDLWQELIRAMERHTVSFVWVKGHAENQYNNRCDKLAVEESKKFQ